MREIKHYVAWDCSKFESESECLAYEERAKKSAQEFNEAYSFYDKDMNMIFSPGESADVEEWVDWLGYAGDECIYIKRKANLTQEAENLYNREWGIGVLNKDFDNELGLFRYDFKKNKWVKVGE